MFLFLVYISFYCGFQLFGKNRVLPAFFRMVGARGDRECTCRIEPCVVLFSPAGFIIRLFHALYFVSICYLCCIIRGYVPPAAIENCFFKNQIT